MPDSLEQLASEVTSAASNEFNTDVHVANKDGTPKYTKTGKFRKRKSADSDSVVDVAEPEPASAPLYAEMGNVMAVTITSSCTMLLGPEWKPEQQEIDGLTAAWAKYFEASGISEFPPWLMLAMVHVSYAGKRLTMPETKSRLRQFIDRIRKRRAYVNSGNDIERQDDAGNESRENL